METTATEGLTETPEPKSAETELRKSPERKGSLSPRESKVSPNVRKQLASVFDWISDKEKEEKKEDPPAWFTGYMDSYKDELVGEITSKVVQSLGVVLENKLSILSQNNNKRRVSNDLKSKLSAGDTKKGIQEMFQRRRQRRKKSQSSQQEEEQTAVKVEEVISKPDEDVDLNKSVTETAATPAEEAEVEHENQGPNKTEENVIITVSDNEEKLTETQEEVTTPEAQADANTTAAASKGRKETRQGVKELTKRPRPFRRRRRQTFSEYGMNREFRYLNNRRGQEVGAKEIQTHDSEGSNVAKNNEAASTERVAGQSAEQTARLRRRSQGAIERRRNRRRLARAARAQRRQEQARSVSEGAATSPGKDLQITPTKECPVTPTKECPVTPTKEYPITPTKEYPVTPTKEYPITPTKEYPVTPTKEYPITPTKEYPITPTKEYPLTPTKEYPLTPVKNYPIETVEVFNSSKPINNIAKKVNSAEETESFVEPESIESPVGASKLSAESESKDAESQSAPILAQTKATAGEADELDKSKDGGPVPSTTAPEHLKVKEYPRVPKKDVYVCGTKPFHVRRTEAGDEDVVRIPSVEGIRASAPSSKPEANLIPASDKKRIVIDLTESGESDQEEEEGNKDEGVNLKTRPEKETKPINKSEITEDVVEKAEMNTSDEQLEHYDKLPEVCIDLSPVSNEYELVGFQAPRAGSVTIDQSEDSLILVKQDRETIEGWDEGIVVEEEMRMTRSRSGSLEDFDFVDIPSVPFVKL